MSWEKLDKQVEAKIYEAKQKGNWFIDGIGIHGLTPKLFSGLSTERLCELYNVELSYFKR